MLSMMKIIIVSWFLLVINAPNCIFEVINIYVNLILALNAQQGAILNS